MGHPRRVGPPYKFRSSSSTRPTDVYIHIYIERERERETYCVYIHMYMYMYIYIYIYVHFVYQMGGRPKIRNRLRKMRSRRPKKTDPAFIGWSNNTFRNLHFIISLETNKLTTYAAEQPLRRCYWLKRRLLKFWSTCT